MGRSFARFSTDDPLNTFGGAGVVEIPNMQKLLRMICEQGFEHHVAASFSSVADPILEASSKYLGWTMHRHDWREPRASNSQLSNSKLTTEQDPPSFAPRQPTRGVTANTSPSVREPAQYTLIELRKGADSSVG